MQTFEKARKATLLKKSDVLLIHGQQLLDMLAEKDMHRFELYLRKTKAVDNTCGGVRLLVVARCSARDRGVWGPPCEG